LPPDVSDFKGKNTPNMISARLRPRVTVVSVTKAESYKNHFKIISA